MPDLDISFLDGREKSTKFLHILTEKRGQGLKGEENCSDGSNHKKNFIQT